MLHSISLSTASCEISLYSVNDLFSSALCSQASNKLSIHLRPLPFTPGHQSLLRSSGDFEKASLKTRETAQECGQGGMGSLERVTVDEHNFPLQNPGWVFSKTLQWPMCSAVIFFTALHTFPVSWESLPCGGPTSLAPLRNIVITFPPSPSLWQQVRGCTPLAAVQLFYLRVSWELQSECNWVPAICYCSFCPFTTCSPPLHFLHYSIALLPKFASGERSSVSSAKKKGCGQEGAGLALNFFKLLNSNCRCEEIHLVVWPWLIFSRKFYHIWIICMSFRR